MSAPEILSKKRRETIAREWAHLAGMTTIAPEDPWGRLERLVKFGKETKALLDHADAMDKENDRIHALLMASHARAEPKLLDQDALREALASMTEREGIASRFYADTRAAFDVLHRALRDAHTEGEYRSPRRGSGGLHPDEIIDTALNHPAVLRVTQLASAEVTP